MVRVVVSGEPPAGERAAFQEDVIAKLIITCVLVIIVTCVSYCILSNHSIFVKMMTECHEVSFEGLIGFSFTKTASKPACHSG